MPASAPITCTADTWVKVATSVTSAVVHKLSTLPNVYKQTYVATGAGVPVSDLNAVALFDGCNSDIFSESESSDIYVKAVSVVGSVRVDA